jgi:hypothetical protein
VCAAVYFTQFLLVPMTSLAHTKLYLITSDVQRQDVIELC